MGAGPVGGRSCEPIGPLGLAVIEPAGGDPGEALVDLHLVEEALDLGAPQKALGHRQAGAQDVAANLLLDAVNPDPLLAAALAWRGVGVGFGSDADELIDPRLLRALVVCRATLDCQLVDPVGARMIGISIHPALELDIFGAIGGGMHVALLQDVPHQAVVLQLRDQRVGLAPLAALLQGEDVPVTRLVLGREHRRQFLAIRFSATGQGGQGRPLPLDRRRVARRRAAIRRERARGQHRKGDSASAEQANYPSRDTRCAHFR